MFYREFRRCQRSSPVNVGTARHANLSKLFAASYMGERSEEGGVRERERESDGKSDIDFSQYGK